MLYKTIEWLSRADYGERQRLTRFGSVSDQYRKLVLNRHALHPEVAHYFEACVPDEEYECCVGTEGYSMLDDDGLIEDTHDRSYSEVLTELGFCIFGRSMGSTPLLLCPESGRVCRFLSDYLYDEYLWRPSLGRRSNKLPATFDLVVEWSDMTWDGLLPFFEYATASTRDMLRGDVIANIASCSLKELQHYHRLGLPLDMTGDEGRTPLEVARETGNREVIEIVRGHPVGESVRRHTSRAIAVWAMVRVLADFSITKRLVSCRPPFRECATGG